MKLYDYHRSSAAYRVRIALNLKGIEYERVAVDLRKGEQRDPNYLAIDPQGLVPALATDDGVLTQSIAIIEYLEETHPAPPLLAHDSHERAVQRAMAAIIACDVHPLGNLRVLQYLRGQLGHEETEVRAWISNWVRAGFTALEAQAGDAPHLGGETPMLSDVCLVPQMFNARRFDVELRDFPRLLEITQRLEALDAFVRAAPDAPAADQ